MDRERRRAGIRGALSDSPFSLAAVMGDIGKGLYVAEDVVPIYRQMLAQATIITPNQFEAEWVPPGPLAGRSSD